MSQARKNVNINVGASSSSNARPTGARPTSSSTAAYGGSAQRNTNQYGSNNATSLNSRASMSRPGQTQNNSLGASNQRGSSNMGVSGAGLGSRHGGSSSNPVNSNNLGLAGAGVGSSGSGGGISAFMKAIIEINANLPTLNHFFHPFDCFADRTFEAWELYIMFEGKVSERDIHELCEKNQTVEALKQNQCKAQYLFDQLKFAPNAPMKFQSGVFEGKPTSLYLQKQTILDTNPQLLQMLQHLMNHIDDLKLGHPEKAFETLFPKAQAQATGMRGQSTPAQKFEVITVERLRSIAPTYQMTQFSLETFQACVDWICSTPGQYSFTKLNFVAAFRYLIAKYNPTLAQSEKIVIPGLNAPSIASTGSSQVPNYQATQNPTIAPLLSNQMSMPTGQPSTAVGYQQPQGNTVASTLQQALQVYFQKQVGSFAQQDCDMMVQGVKQAKQLSLQQRMAPGIIQKLDQLEPCLNQMQLNNPIFQTTTRTLINDVLSDAQNSQTTTPGVLPTTNAPQPIQPYGTTSLASGMQQSPMNPAQNIVGMGGSAMNLSNQVQNAQQQELLNRVCESLALKKKTLPELMMGVPVTPFSGKNTYQSHVFSQKCKEVFSMSDVEAGTLSQFFGMSQVGQPSLVDSDAFAQKVVQEQNKFSQAVNLYGNLIDRIQESLRQRHTGVHKWFKSYMQISVMDQQISKDEMQRAIQNLGASVVQNVYELDGLFQGLDFNKSGKIYLTDIESLFKANSRKTMPKINPQEVFVQILRAFNADFEHIKQELSRVQMMNQNVLSLDDALTFFKTPGFQAFYQIDNVHILLDTFVLSGGRLELADFLYQLNLARQTNNLQPNLQQQGIHRQGQNNPATASQNHPSSYQGLNQMQQQQQPLGGTLNNGMAQNSFQHQSSMAGSTGLNTNNALQPPLSSMNPPHSSSFGQQSQIISTNTSPQEVCEAIVKRIDSRGQTIDSFLQQLAAPQQQQMHQSIMSGQGSMMYGQMNQAQFCQIFGTQLNLVPSILRDDQLQSLFQEIARSVSNQPIQPQYGAAQPQGQQVSHNDISRYFNQNTQIPQIKQKVLQKLQNQPIRRFLEQIPSFNMSQGKISEQEFKQTLQRSAQMSELDCDFIARFYIQQPPPMQSIQSHQRIVDANQFIRDCQNPSLVNSSGMGQKANLMNNNQSNPSMNMNQERQVREALLKVSQAIKKDQSQTIQRKFNSLQKGRSDSMVELIGFSTVLRQINVLTSEEQRHIEMKYASPKSQHMINLNQFMEDLREISQNSGNSSQNLQNQLPGDLKRDYEQVAQVFKLGDVVSKFVFYLKEKDITGQGYLNQQMIQGCFDAAYADRKKVQGASLPTNFIARLPNMFQPVTKNAQGFFSYKEILQLLFGSAEGNKLFAMSKAQLQQLIGQADEGRQVAYVKPVSVVNPQGRFMGDIGQKILMSPNDNVENQIKVQLGPSPKSNKLQANQAENVLQSMQVFLSNEERSALSDWIRQNVDNQGLFDAVAWLQALGLPNQTLQIYKERKVPRKILNPQELSQSQQLLTAVARDISQTQGKVLQDVINRYSSQGQVKNISPASFKKFITTECTRDMASKVSDNEKLSNLVHYLVLDEPGKVSLIKLLKAFNLGPRDAPLKQDGTQEFAQYSKQITQQLQKATSGANGVPAEVFQLLNFLKQNNLTLQKVFKLKANQIIKSFDIIKGSEFNLHLQEIAFESQNLAGLNDHLKTPQDKSKVSLHTLEEFRKKFNKTQTQGRKNQNYGNLSTSTQNKLKNITEWLQFNGHSSSKIHEMLDINKDGVVDRDEFINGFVGAQIRGIKSPAELGQIFDEIDINKDQYLDLNEFSIFVKGAQQSREQRINELPKEVQDEIERDLMDLFREFDDDKSGDIDKWEILKVMQGLGVEMNEQKAGEMIATVDKNGNGKIDVEEFKQLMKPKFLEQVLSQEDSLEDFRALFVEADTDNTGFLSADEIYNVLVKQGIVVTFEEMVQLIEQFDISGDAQLDIDEFIAMMNAGDNLNFSSNGARDTYLKIKKSRRLNVMDFIKAFGNLPQSFVPSIIGKKWNQERQNMPSSAFSAKIDKNTMNWKDMEPVSASELSAEMQQKDNMPAFKPIQTSLGAEITIEFAEGIPLPADSTSFDRKTVTQRAVRVCLFDSARQDFIGNACQVGAKWEQSAEDKWSFNTKTQIGENPLLFRSTQHADFDPKSISVVFELVLFMKATEKNKQTTKEVSCGWCMTSLDSLSRDASKLKLDLQGGTPSAQIIIAENDVNTNRQGIAGLMKAFSSKITSGLCISIKSFANLEADTKLHMNLLPRACLLPRRLLQFVSGYRNYAAKMLLKQAAFEKTKERPAGNVVISAFNKMLDNPDIQQTLILVWSEDVLAPMTGAQKKSIQFATEKMELFIQRIYPLLHASEFQLTEQNLTQSVCHDPILQAKRENLLLTALRAGTQKAKSLTNKKPLEEQTSFKPFNVREIEWDSWQGQQKAKTESILNSYQNMGIIGNGGNRLQQAQQVPFDPNQNIQLPQRMF